MQNGRFTCIFASASSFALDRTLVTAPAYPQSFDQPESPWTEPISSSTGMMQRI